MAQKFTLDIVTPEASLYSKEVEMVVLPGKDGDFGVLELHAPVIASLRPGVVRVFAGGSIKERILVTGGFVEVNSERCTVLATLAYNFNDVSRKGLEERLEVIRKIHRDASDEHSKQKAEEEVQLAEAIIEAFISEQDQWQK